VNRETAEQHEARGARTQALFRDINERVKQINSAFEVVLALGDWGCECVDDACTERLYLSYGEYERIRSDPTRFIVMPDDHHVDTTIEDVVERADTYWVVQKRGRAAGLVTAVDPRAVGRRGHR
jgi:hypothetical protein